MGTLAQVTLAEYISVFFFFFLQLVTIKTVSKDTKQIPSQAVAGSGQLFLFQIIAGLANSEQAIIGANIEPFLNTVWAWQVNPSVLWKIIIFHLTKEVLNVLLQPSTFSLFASFELTLGWFSGHLLKQLHCKKLNFFLKKAVWYKVLMQLRSNIYQRKASLIACTPSAPFRWAVVAVDVLLWTVHVSGQSRLC